MTVKIVINSIPPSLNTVAGRENVWRYRDAKAVYTKAVYYAAIGQRPPVPFKFSAVRIDYYFKDARRHDADNYCGKFLLDGLTKAGIILDDDFGHISLTVHGHVDRKKTRTEITVIDQTELEAET